MLAIAGQLCTLWEIMGGVQRGRDAPGVMFHISTSHRRLDRKQLPVMSPSSSTLRGSALAFLLHTHAGEVKPGSDKTATDDKQALKEAAAGQTVCA